MSLFLASTASCALALSLPMRPGSPGKAPRPTARSKAAAGHMVSGLQVQAAGVVPYVEMPGQGVKFLLQKMVNGTRAGKICDFGGRREKGDPDMYFTAAREFSEETNGAFGDAHSLAERLRQDSSVRILNREGRYMTFFLKVSYVHEQSLPTVDHTSQETDERQCKWWRADELLGRGEDVLLARMVNHPRNYRNDLRPADGGESGLNSFHKAVCKTLALENAHPLAHERWHSTVLSDLAASRARRAREKQAAAFLVQDTAYACVSGTRPQRPGSRPSAGRPASRRPSNRRGKACDQSRGDVSSRRGKGRDQMLSSREPSLGKHRGKTRHGYDLSLFSP